MREEIKHLSYLGTQLKAGALPVETIQSAGLKNPWFTEEFIRFSLQSLADNMLNEDLLTEWANKYPIKKSNKTLGLIFAGNIPLVGFHDLLCAYLAGLRMKIKLSSKDEVLFPALLNLLKKSDKNIDERVVLVDKLADFDAVIATGSSNTHRHFEYYFRNHPKILRANRNGVAVLTGEESFEQLERLADDIFLFFGLGCRNVSKLYVPVGYDFNTLFPYLRKYSWLHSFTKYMNNYDYNRTLLMMNNTPHQANDFVMLREHEQIASPLATLHYEYWHDEKVLTTKLNQQSHQIQCVVSALPLTHFIGVPVDFGQTQHPALNDYADGVDTMQFLTEL